MEREQAWNIVTEFVQSESLRKHMLSVEFAMRAYAEHYAENPDSWGLVGLLHDFDWEIHPTLETHPMDGAPILRERGLDEADVQTILKSWAAGTAHHPARQIASRGGRTDRLDYRDDAGASVEGYSRSRSEIDSQEVERQGVCSGCEPRRN